MGTAHDEGERRDATASPRAPDHTLDEPKSRALALEQTLDISRPLAMPRPLSELADVAGQAGLAGLADQFTRGEVYEALFEASGESMVLDRYVLMGILGRGGMGTVFKAFDPALDRRVALKVLHQELDEGYTKRLHREAQALAKLSHPNVVQVYEAGEVDGQTYVAMELVNGQTLEQWMDTKPRPGWQECVELFLRIGAGLAAAHEQGLVHRDFKPSNAIIDTKGRPRVLDFGLARQAEGEHFEAETHSVKRARPSESDPVLELSLTQSGAVLGTPAYMPPEQMRGEQEADARSDQFSFCVSLYEALYGERPYEGTSIAALTLSMQHGGIQPAPRGSRVPAKLRAVVARGLAPDPDERWPSMEALLEQLRALVAPRRARWIAVSITAGLVAMGVGLTADRYAAWASRCTGAEDHIEDVWGDSIRGQLEQAILGTRLAYAQQTWDQVEQQLDHYTDAWVTKHTEVCEATRITGEQTDAEMSLRMRCLDRHEVALRATLKVLEHADAQTVEKAVDVVGNLPALARCDDLERLQQAQQAIPPPDDPKVAADVEQLREQLARLSALQNAGRHAQALLEIETVLQDAAGLEYPPLMAEGMLQRGLLRENDGRYDHATTDLRRAYLLALEHGHEEVELRAAQGMAFVLGDRLGHPDDGVRWAQVALALARHDGSDLVLGSSLTGMGTAQLNRGEYEAALENLQLALSLLETAQGPEHLGLTDTLNNLANVFNHMGRYDEAIGIYQRALGIRQKAQGADHPKIASGLNNLATVLERQNELDAAHEHLQRALAIQRKVLKEDHPKIAASLTNLAIVVARQGDREQALRYHEQALQIRERALGADHLLVADTLSNMGVMLGVSGRREQALPLLERALQIREQALGRDAKQLIDVLHYIGQIELAQKQYAKAEAVLRREVKLRERAYGDEHATVATSETNLGDTLLRQGKHQEAHTHFERAQEIREAVLPPDHLHLAWSLMGLARVALAQGQPAAAREHAERAVKIREAGGEKAPLLAEARFVLAQALWSEREQRGRAHSLAQQARDVLAPLGSPHEDELARIDRWLSTHPAP